MDMPTIEALKNARIKWLDVSFSYKDKNHFIEIRTPFPDMCWVMTVIPWTNLEP